MQPLKLTFLKLVPKTIPPPAKLDPLLLKTGTLQINNAPPPIEISPLLSKLTPSK